MPLRTNEEAGYGGRAFRLLSGRERQIRVGWRAGAWATLTAAASKPRMRLPFVDDHQVQGRQALATFDPPANAKTMLTKARQACFSVDVPTRQQHQPSNRTLMLSLLMIFRGGQHCSWIPGDPVR